MAKHLRYWGEFDGQDGILTRIEIYQEATEAFDLIGELKFPHEEPLIIEWTEVDKLEPVQTSQATLTLRSVIDRQYIDLYTIAVGSIRMDVLRSGILYWSGTLDPEFYEEPFSEVAEYDVSLTFTDLGILDRIDFDGAGYASFENLLEKCLLASAINYTAVQKYISTTRIGMTGDVLLTTSINQGNFFDEDGVASTLRDVLDAILRPFSLRLMQKAGAIFIYDLNAIHAAIERRAIVWDGTDATLGVDKVYNQAKIIFSPYEKTSLLDENIEVDELNPYQADLLWRIDMHSTNGIMDSPDGFFLDLYNPTPTGYTINASAKIFKLNPANSGDASTGIAWRVRRKDTKDGTSVSIVGNDVRRYFNPVAGSLLMKVNKRIDAPKYYTEVVGGTERPDVLIKIEVPMLIDCRYNPYETTSADNEKDISEYLTNRFAGFCVPIHLRIKDSDGNVLLHYENIEGGELANPDVGNMKKGIWAEGDYDTTRWNFAVLTYYNRTSPTSGYSGGWQSNYMPGYYSEGNVVVKNYSISERQKRLGSGDYIIPPTSAIGGILDLEVLEGIYYFGSTRVENTVVFSVDYTTDNNDWTSWFNKNINWLMYKAPIMTLTDYNGNDIDSEDLEYTSWINKSAKESIEIDTIIGNGGKQQKRGLGLMLDSTSLEPVVKYTRNGVTDYIERLLLGTIYSNYSTRKNTLSGTVKMLTDFGIYTDTSQPGNYCLLSETQKLREATSEIKMVEFEADNYQGIDA